MNWNHADGFLFLGRDDLNRGVCRRRAAATGTLTPREMSMFSLSYREGYKHCVGEANYHFQFTPKYRRPVFSDGLVKMACANAMRHIAGRLAGRRATRSGIRAGPLPPIRGQVQEPQRLRACTAVQGRQLKTPQTPTMEQTLQQGTRRSLLLEFRILLRISGTNNQRQNKILHRAPARQTLDQPKTHNTQRDTHPKQPTRLQLNQSRRPPLQWREYVTDPNINKKFILYLNGPNSQAIKNSLNLPSSVPYSFTDSKGIFRSGTVEVIVKAVNL